MVSGILEIHLQNKLERDKWLYPLVESRAQDFPYKVAETGEGEIAYNGMFYPNVQCAHFPCPNAEPLPRFIINIPDGRAPNCSDDTKYYRIMSQIALEAFDTGNNLAGVLFQQVSAVVIATNKVSSIDSRLDEAFIRMVKESKIDEAPCRRIGFLWKPKYKKLKEGFPSIHLAFWHLRVLNPALAEEVRQYVEQPDGKLHEKIVAQIPFQKIRQLIFKSGETRTFADFFQCNAPFSPLYLTVMDNDFVSLRTKAGYGALYSVLRAVQPANPQSVIGCGYRVADGEVPLVRYAVRIDMSVRAAMVGAIAYGSYLPEPLLCVLLRRPGVSNHLKELSFLGDGRALESRRIIENGKARGVLNDNMTFLPDGIVTGFPERWLTEKNRKYVPLPSVKMRYALEALRGLSQSHAHPKKWADQLYTALPFKSSRVTDATTPMMQIFKVFDPISRMYVQANLDGRYSKKVFDKVLATYNQSLNAVQINLLYTAIANLSILGMDNPTIQVVINAAAGSGVAIRDELVAICRERGE